MSTAVQKTILLIILIPFVFGNLKKVKFSKNYTSTESPISKNGIPIQVNISTNLRNIFEVNEKISLITTEMSIRMTWRDPRIRAKAVNKWTHEYVSFNGKAIMKQFWIPDIFIDGAKDLRVPKYRIRPTSLRVYKDGKIRFSSRLNFDVICHMDFHFYPNDLQVCDIHIESWDSSKEAMLLNWDLEHSSINPNITLVEFSPRIHYVIYDTASYYESTYSGLIIRIELDRHLTYHIIQTYIPSIIYVVTAWLSLFLNPDAVPGRVAMTMMSLLTTMSMFSSVRKVTPQVSYISYLDIWMVICMLFIFSILVEFSAVLCCIRKGKKELATTIDLVSTVCFPLAFSIFNLGYWISLFHASDSYKKH